MEGLDGGELLVDAWQSREKVGRHGGPLLVLDVKVELHHFLLDVVQGLRLPCGGGDERLVVGVDRELPTFEVGAEVVHSPLHCSHLQGEGRIVLLVLVQLPGCVGDNMEVVVLVHLCQDGADAPFFGVRPGGRIRDEGIGTVRSGVRDHGF